MNKHELSNTSSLGDASTAQRKLFSLNRLMGKRAERTPRERLVWLMNLLLGKRMSIDDFCAEYERTWNFQLNEESLSQSESELLKRVFDTVVWYTPVAEDRKNYPGFQSESDVFTVVTEVQQQLERRVGADDSVG